MIQYSKKKLINAIVLISVTTNMIHCSNDSVSPKDNILTESSSSSLSLSSSKNEQEQPLSSSFAELSSNGISSVEDTLNISSSHLSSEINSSATQESSSSLNISSSTMDTPSSIGNESSIANLSSSQLDRSSSTIIFSSTPDLSSSSEIESSSSQIMDESSSSVKTTFPPEIDPNAYWFNMKNHLGRLGGDQGRDNWWGLNVRDAFRSSMEIPGFEDENELPELTASDLNKLSDFVNKGYTLISQVGGMGSAKPQYVIPGTDSVVSKEYAGDKDLVLHRKVKLFIETIKDPARRAIWQDKLIENTQTISSALSGDQKFYWQIGNEISAFSYGDNARLYNGEIDPNAPEFDSEIIPFYVEFFFAPAVEAIRNANASNIKIALGSITVFSNSKAPAFLDDLLSYQIQGTYTTSGVAGKTVADFVDIITIHYLMAGEPSDTNPWKDRLNDVKDKWINNGSYNIEGIWSTEELGSRGAEGGAGAATVLRVASRYFEWISENQFSGSHVKCFYYAVGTGPKDINFGTGDSSLDVLHTFVTGENSIHAETFIITHMISGGKQLNYEGRRFLFDNGWKSFTIFTFEVKGDPVTLSEIPLTELPSDEVYFGNSSETYLFTNDGGYQVEGSINFSKGVFIPESPITSTVEGKHTILVMTE